MGVNTLARNVVIASLMLRRESDTERRPMDMNHTTPQNIFPERHSGSQKMASGGLAKRSQTRVVVSELPMLPPTRFQTARRRVLCWATSLKLLTMTTSGRRSSTALIIPPGNSVPRLFNSTYLLWLSLVTILLRLFNTSLTFHLCCSPL